MCERLETFCHDLWYGRKRTFINFILLPFALLYGALSFLRAKMFDWDLIKIKKLSVPVISIGNITIGGTGKTPLAIYIAKMLLESGIRPAIVSRGYGGKRKSGEIILVSDGKKVLLDEEIAGDEAVLMAMESPGVPVLVGADRFSLGRDAVDNLNAEAVILDDGFQHRRLHRQVNICVVNSALGLGNRLPLPAGPLREFPHAIRRADIIVLTGASKMSEQKTGLERCCQKYDKPVLKADYLPTSLTKDGKILALERIKGKTVCAFCGIGNPKGFRKTIEEAGASCLSLIAYPDHYRYEETDIARIEKVLKKSKAEFLLTTQKDAVKVKRFSSFYKRVFILSIALVPEAGDNTLNKFIHQVFAGEK